MTIKLFTFARTAVLAIGLAVAFPGGIALAQTAETKANVDLVKAFFAAGNDPDKAASYFSEDGTALIAEGQPPLVGRAAIAQALRAATAGGAKLSAKIISSFAAGPVVVSKRVDGITTPDNKTQSYKLVGFFVIKNHKITEWREFSDE